MHVHRGADGSVSAELPADHVEVRRLRVRERPPEGVRGAGHALSSPEDETAQVVTGGGASFGATKTMTIVHSAHGCPFFFSGAITTLIGSPG